MPTAATVDEYIAGFPPPVAERLERIRGIIVGAVADAWGAPPEEKIRYGIAAVMLGGRYALHYAGWKKHIGLYPVPSFDGPLDVEVAPYRAEKDSLVFPHAAEMPYELIDRVAREIAAQRVAAKN